MSFYDNALRVLIKIPRSYNIPVKQTMSVCDVRRHYAQNLIYFAIIYVCDNFKRAMMILWRLREKEIWR